MSKPEIKHDDQPEERFPVGADTATAAPPAPGSSSDASSGSSPSGGRRRIRKRIRVKLEKPPDRLVSLDAYRGLIMVLLAASGFGIAALARLPAEAPVWNRLDRDVVQSIAFHFDHPPWRSRFGLLGVSFWDLIQPAFMFMVGVAMPYSFARRKAEGQDEIARWQHVIFRSVVLVLLGVFLASQSSSSTNWIFTNVLAQIGLGYSFAYLVMQWNLRGRLLAFAGILVGTWLLMESYTPPEGYDYAAVNAGSESVFEGRFASWSKNANLFHKFDVRFLNLFPRPNGEQYLFNAGGYTTLNFIPSIATMILGILCGDLLRSRRKSWMKVAGLVAGGVVCLAVGILADQTICPIVKRIWTPSWVLFSGGYVILMLALLYVLADVLKFGALFLPLTIVGMNSLLMYLLGQTMRPWTVETFQVHFGRPFEYFVPGIWADNMYGRVAAPIAALVVFWLLLALLYRKKLFLRV